MTRDPFGAEGDFITAPEVSQFFGEMIALWFLDFWQSQKNLGAVHFVELGAGRGTLMRDILQTIANFPDSPFHKIHILEASPVLQKKQKSLLQDWQEKISWHSSWDSLAASLDDGAPIFFVANEFFDALPIEQWRYHQNIWQQRFVEEKEGARQFIWQDSHDTPHPMPDEIEEDKIWETSIASQDFMQKITARLQRQKGAALLIDYGHLTPGYGETLQAVQNHAYADPLENPGAADLTAHVDFAVLQKIAAGKGLAADLTTQRHFLLSLGILHRLDQMIKAHPARAGEWQSQIHRLTDEKEMGSLFKVMIVKKEA